jgi:hypothetical protein
MASEAAMFDSARVCCQRRPENKPIPLSLVELSPGEPGMVAFSSLDAIAGVDGVREKVLARGPRWVSLSSAYGIY